MKGLETGKDKVKKICELLKRETLEPAQTEAQQIIDTARRRADEMVAEAHRKIEEMHEVAHLEIQQQKSIFEASLSHACRQTLEVFKEKIEQKLFNPELTQLLAKPLQESKIVAKLIEAVIQAIEKEGIESDLSAFISSAVPAEEVNQLLSQKILARLKEKGVLLSSMGGGVEIKIVDQNVIIDLSENALKELIAHYIRKDFRHLLFRK